MLRAALLIFFAGSIAAAQSNSRKLIASSGTARVHLVELYSSESCSSCPPADQKAGTFRNSPELFKTFVPVVFHVDYWNDLGWVDGLSSNSMTRRQRDLAQTWPKPGVYTPAFVADGNEWKGWSNSGIPNSAKQTGISLDVFRNASGEFDIAAGGLASSGQGERFVIRIALLGVGLSTAVTSGENSGRTLAHNFVVLNWDAKEITNASPHASFRLVARGNPPKSAIAVWIERVGSPAPLQATGAYL